MKSRGWLMLAGILAALVALLYFNRGKLGMALVGFLEKLEGRENRAYLDTAGYWTIGVGHKILPDERARYVGQVVTIKGKKRGSVVISEEEIDRLAAEDTAKAAAAVDSGVRVPITAGQRAALIAFAFNVGVNAFRSSTLLRKLNAGDYKGAAAEFPKWNKETVNGQKVANKGLTVRRLAERTAFEGGIA